MRCFRCANSGSIRAGISAVIGIDSRVIYRFFNLGQRTLSGKASWTKQVK